MAKKRVIATSAKTSGIPTVQHRYAIYFTSLQVENVRPFGTSQRFDLIDAKGVPVPWTLIVGESGAGKTALLQCLARMQPFPQWKRGKNGKAEVDKAIADKAPNYVEPELLQFENEDLVRLLRTCLGMLRSYRGLDTATQSADNGRERLG